MTDCIDVSNYTDTLTPEALEAWKQDGVRLVIVQAVDPPPGYPAGKTRQQIQQCLDAGLAVDAYIWLWFDLGVADIQRKLTLLDGLPIRQLWLDVEDTAAAKYDQAACDQKVGDALAVCDSYPGTGRKTTGIYTGRWFWADRRYMNDSHYFAERPLWDSLYDDIQDTTAYTPYGGWQSCAIKQFHGTSTFHGVGGVDLNVLSESEAASLDGGNVTDPERQAYEDKINGLVSSLGYIGGDVLKPLTRKNAATYVKTAVEQIRGVCDQQGIAHA